MSDNLPSIPMGGTLRAIASATTPAEKAKLQAAAVELVSDDRFPKPVPRFIAELPHVGSDEEVQLRIAASLLTAEDPDAEDVTASGESSKGIVGKPLTVHDLRTSASAKERGVGAFLILDVTFDDEDEHKVVTTGAVQAMTRLARAWADDDLPLRGAFTHVPGTGGEAKDPVITFMAWRPF